MKLLFPALLLAIALSVSAQKPQTPTPKGIKATAVRVANLYVQPDEGSNRVGEVTPGRELVITERSGKWLRVFANTDVEVVSEQDTPVFGNEQDTPPLSGWMLDKGIVSTETDHGADILFGAAATAESRATEPHSPPRAAMDARRMYRMVAQIFPQASWAAESAWRAADIRWQLQKADNQSLPSAHEKESYLRPQIDESEMRKIEHLYPGSRWADFAVYAMIDNKLCGDWQGSERCPEKEADLYVKYADEYPGSPRAPQALYEAIWRLASAGDMWTSDNNDKRAGEDRAKARALATRVETKYGDSEYSARAAALIYRVDQQIPIYGSERE